MSSKQEATARPQGELGHEVAAINALIVHVRNQWHDTDAPILALADAAFDERELLLAQRDRLVEALETFRNQVRTIHASAFVNCANDSDTEAINRLTGALIGIQQQTTAAIEQAGSVLAEVRGGGKPIPARQHPDQLNLWGE